MGQGGYLVTPASVPSSCPPSHSPPFPVPTQGSAGSRGDGSSQRRASDLGDASHLCRGCFYRRAGQGWAGQGQLQSLSFVVGYTAVPLPPLLPLPFQCISSLIVKILHPHSHHCKLSSVCYASISFSLSPLTSVSAEPESGFWFLNVTNHSLSALTLLCCVSTFCH